MTRRPDPFAPAQHTAQDWLDAVAHQLGTDDRRFAHRALRAWLHVVRDRLTLNTAAHLAAQLPELLRGLFYEGWHPSHLPIRYDSTEFTNRYAHAAGISRDDVAPTAAAVTAALRERFSPGQLDNALAQLPRRLRAHLYPQNVEPEANEQHRDGDDRLDQLEDAVTLLTTAVTTLASGLAHTPLDEPDSERAAAAAKAAHRILLTVTGAHD